MKKIKEVGYCFLKNNILKIVFDYNLRLGDIK